MLSRLSRIEASTAKSISLQRNTSTRQCYRLLGDDTFLARKERVEYRPLLAVTKSIGPRSLTSKRFRSVGEPTSASSVPVIKVALREKSQCRHCSKWIRGGRHDNAVACNNWRLTHLQDYRVMCQALGIEPAT